MNNRSNLPSGLIAAVVFTSSFLNNNRRSREGGRMDVFCLVIQSMRFRVGIRLL